LSDLLERVGFGFGFAAARESGKSDQECEEVLISGRHGRDYTDESPGS
jgi:hypothetical protein